MRGDQAGERSRFPGYVALGKDVIALLRDASLLVLAGALLVSPGRFNDLLVSAGFEEGSFAGFRWKSKLVQADDALKEAQATIGSLQDQLEKTQAALNEARSRIQDRELTASVQKLEAENQRVGLASAGVSASVRSTIAANAPFVEKAQSALDVSGGWGVVFGSDLSVAAARDEIARAARQGVEPAGIYFRNGYYASIAVVDERAVAQKHLASVKTFRPDAYIATMATWCRSPQQREGFVECESRR